jgi:hypothetical protein
VRYIAAVMMWLKRFKQNIEHPKRSGVDAVHGVPKSRLKHAKMTVEEGLAFIIRLLDSYVDKHP